ncbi:MAG: peptidylprolyl isomerase [Anaerolineales bacterium]|nr:peptidylprolyl isomerase [Anaerolineales bacterium]
MRKNAPLLLLLLAACGTATPTPQTEAPLATPRDALHTSLPCTVINPPVTDPVPLAATINPDDHADGPAEAPVTILAFGDYQCLGCAVLAIELQVLRSTHPEQVRLVYRHFPVPAAFDKSALAVGAAEAADLQDHFWEMHDLLYARQNEWTGLEPEAFHRWLVEAAAGLGLDPARFESDLAGETVAARVEAAVQFAAGVQSPSLPLLFINSTAPYTGLIDYASLEAMVGLSLLQPRRLSACPPMSVDPLRQYLARLQTTRGEVVIQLFVDKVPTTVANFVFLARSGWYNDVPFHRVLPGLLVQTGDPSGSGMGNPGYFIPDEISPLLRFDRPGQVAMVNAGPGTGGSQFFITLAPAPQLDSLYPIFGEVLAGLDLLAGMNARDPQPGGPYQPPEDAILSVTIEER